VQPTTKKASHSGLVVSNAASLESPCTLEQIAHKPCGWNKWRLRAISMSERTACPQPRTVQIACSLCQALIPGIGHLSPSSLMWGNQGEVLGRSLVALPLSTDRHFLGVWVCFRPVLARCTWQEMPEITRRACCDRPLCTSCAPKTHNCVHMQERNFDWGPPLGGGSRGGDFWEHEPCGR